MEDYGVKPSHGIDVEETLPFCQGMDDAAAAETSNPIVVSGLWLSPGKDLEEIHFLAQRDSEIRSVYFGKIEEGVGIRGKGYQLWLPLETELMCGLAVGFHHNNTTTSMLKAHWLLPEGCGVWRCQDHRVSFVLQNVYESNKGIYESNKALRSLTWDLMPFTTISEFNESTGIEFDPTMAKILLKWYAPNRNVAYVLLRTDESIQFAKAGERTPGEANGVWSYFQEEDGSEFLITWFHYSGKRNASGEPQAEATVLQKVNSKSDLLNEVPIWRAVGTLKSGVENFMVQKYVGADAKNMREWHVFVQCVWQSEV